MGATGGTSPAGVTPASPPNSEFPLIGTLILDAAIFVFCLIIRVVPPIYNRLRTGLKTPAETAENGDVAAGTRIAADPLAETFAQTGVGSASHPWSCGTGIELPSGSAAVPSRESGRMRDRLSSYPFSDDGADNEPMPFEGGREVRRNTSFSNYMCYLQVSRDMFLALSVASLVILSLAGCRMPLLAGLTGGAFSVSEAFENEDTIMLVILASSLVYGMIVLIFAHVLQACWWETQLVDQRAAALIDRTLWLKWLPTGDSKRHRRFALGDDEFRRVGRDLSRALEKTIVEQFAGAEYKSMMFAEGSVAGGIEDDGDEITPLSDMSIIDSVEVIPNVKEWMEVSSGLSRAKESAVAYEELLTTCDAKKRPMYQAKHRAMLAKVTKLRLRLLEITLSKKNLSGSAFVTFRHPTYRNQILNNDPPRCWEIQRQLAGGSFYTFGRPPFASVTLKVEQAPHPDDVRWENLQVPTLSRALTFNLTQLVLLGLMLTIVTPEAVDVLLRPVVDSMGRMNRLMSPSLGFFSWLQKNAGPWVMLLINNCILPEAIYYIALAERSKRMALLDIRQLSLNFFFLCVNLVVLPFFGERDPARLLANLTDTFWGEDSDHVVQNIVNFIGVCFFRTNGNFTLKYLLSSAFLTNGSGLLAPLRIEWTMWFKLNYLALTATDKEQAVKPPIYSWGYWYAHGLAITALSLFSCCLYPAALPVTWVFFLVKNKLDRFNLDRRTWELGSENKGVLTISVAVRMRSIVGMWWLVIGFVLCARRGKLKGEPATEGFRTDYPLVLGPPMGILVILLAIAVLVYSFIKRVVAKRSEKHTRLLHVGAGPRQNQRRESIVDLSKQVVAGYVNGYVDNKMRRSSVFFTSMKKAPKKVLTWNVRKNHEVLRPDEGVERFLRTMQATPGLSVEIVLARLRRRLWDSDALDLLLRPPRNRSITALSVEMTNADHRDSNCSEVWVDGLPEVITREDLEAAMRQNSMTQL